MRRFRSTVHMTECVRLDLVGQRNGEVTEDYSINN